MNPLFRKRLALLNPRVREVDTRDQEVVSSNPGTENLLQKWKLKKPKK